MWNRPALLSSCIIGLGIVFILLQSFLWTITNGYKEFSTGITLTILNLLITLCMLVIAICYFVFNWKQKRISAMIPLIVVIIVIVSSLILPEKFISLYQNQFFDKNVHKYNEAVSIINQTNFNNEVNYIELPKNLKYLTFGHEVEVHFKEGTVNIFFPLRSSVGSGEDIVYSSNNCLIYGLKEGFIVKKKRNHWFYVIEK